MENPYCTVAQNEMGDQSMKGLIELFLLFKSVSSYQFEVATIASLERVNCNIIIIFLNYIEY